MTAILDIVASKFMGRSTRSLGLLCIACVLAACSSVEPPRPPTVVLPPAPPPTVIPPPAVSRWLADYAQQLRMLTAAELQAESDRYAGDTTPSGRLRHALALAAVGHPQRDVARAQDIANEVAQGDGTGPMRDAAALIALALLDQQAAETAQQRAQERRREDEKRIAALEVRLRELERRVQEAERRAAEAEKKLSALKQIDKELSERGASPPAAPRPPGNGDNSPR